MNEEKILVFIAVRYTPKSINILPETPLNGTSGFSFGSSDKCEENQDKASFMIKTRSKTKKSAYLGSAKRKKPPPQRGAGASTEAVHFQGR